MEKYRHTGTKTIWQLGCFWMTSIHSCTICSRLASVSDDGKGGHQWEFFPQADIALPLPLYFREDDRHYVYTVDFHATEAVILIHCHRITAGMVAKGPSTPSSQSCQESFPWCH